MNNIGLCAYDVHALLSTIKIGSVSTTEQDVTAFPRLTAFNQGAVYVGCFSGDSPWERHPDADELLFVLDGEVEVTLLCEPVPVLLHVMSGNVLVVPRGIWHRQRAAHSVSLLAVTPERSDISFETDPRLEPSSTITASEDN